MQFGGQVNPDNQLTVVEAPPGDSPCWNAEGCELRAGSRRLRQVCPQQMCAINFHARTWHPSGEKIVSPTLLRYLCTNRQQQSNSGMKYFLFCFEFSYLFLYVTFTFILYLSQEEPSLLNSIFYAYLASTNSGSSVRLISDSLIYLLPRWVSIFFCVSSILKCCMFTFGWNVPIGNSKDASGKLRWGSCWNKLTW